MSKYNICPYCHKRGLHKKHSDAHSESENKEVFLCRYCKEEVNGPLRLSIDFQWNTEDWEGFRLLHYDFNVTKAKMLLASKPHVLIPLACTEDLKSLVTKGKMGIGIIWEDIEEYPEKFNIHDPIIVVEIGDKALLPIDGWHRIAKAFSENIPEIPSFIISKKDSLKLN